MDWRNDSGGTSGEAETADGWETWTNSDGDRVGLDEQLGLLTDVERRGTVQCLSSGPEVMELDALVDCVVACQGESVDRERVTLRLHHIHLPRLADAGVVQYEAEAGLVLTAPDRIAAILELRDLAVD